MINPSASILQPQAPPSHRTAATLSKTDEQVRQANAEESGPSKRKPLFQIDLQKPGSQVWINTPKDYPLYATHSLEAPQTNANANDKDSPTPRIYRERRLCCPRASALYVYKKEPQRANDADG